MTAHTIGPALPDLLEGDVPVFMLHKSFQAAKRHGEVYDAIHALYGSDLGVGAIVRLANEPQTMVEKYMSGHTNVPLRVADPELHRAPGCGWEGAGPLTGYATKRGYLAEVPEKPRAKWIRHVLAEQRDSGATVLLTATGWVSEIEAAKALDRARGFLDMSREEAGDVPMFVSLTLDSRWLSDSRLRGRLLQEIVESTEPYWYLRFYWPEIAVRYGQLTDSAILAGYKELVEVAASEEKKLFLPNSGLTGWVMSALGATGFSTGSSWGEQAFSKPRIVRGPKGVKPKRLNRFFDSTLLHTVEHQEYLRLSEFDGHVEVPTPFSLEMDEVGHDHDLARLHYLVAVAGLQAELAARRPVLSARRQVKTATEFIRSLPRVDQPSGQNRPQHLDAWSALLS